MQLSADLYHMQIAVQEDGETASEHTLDLRATHLHLGLLRISKRTTRKAPKRKQAGDAPEAKEEAQPGVHMPARAAVL